MSEMKRRKTWLRRLVEFALDSDVNQAIDEQQRILQIAPGSARAHYDLAVLHYSQGRIAEAVASCDRALECDPGFAPAYRKLGEIFISAGDYEQAGRYALMAADLGDNSLVEMFERYPAVKKFVKRPADLSDSELI